jgi:hypothetical protein
MTAACMFTGDSGKTCERPAVVDLVAAPVGLPVTAVPRGRFLLCMLDFLSVIGGCGLPADAAAAIVGPFAQAVIDGKEATE